jgi:hypothetical protein
MSSPAQIDAPMIHDAPSSRMNAADSNKISGPASTPGVDFVGEGRKLKAVEAGSPVSTEIEHHPDSSNTITHTYKDGSTKKYAVADHEGLVKGLMSNT